MQHRWPSKYLLVLVILSPAEIWPGEFDDFDTENEGAIGKWTALAELKVETQDEDAGDNLSVELEPAFQRDLGWVFLRGSMGLG